MRMNEFTINSRFFINADLNLVKDMESNAEHRLEPRFMNVLLMLIEHEGEVVRREQLIVDIWNDYGGAEDSLTQAISVIRKTLWDVEKKIIETVPKKGYILHAVINSAQNNKTIITPKKPINFKFAVAGLIAIMLLFVGYLLKDNWIAMPQEKVSTNIAPVKGADEKQSTEVDFSTLKPQEEDYSNTVTTTAPDGTRYRLVAIGDKRPKLWVNGKLISGPEIEKYAEVEGELLRQLWSRQSNHVDTLLINK